MEARTRQPGRKERTPGRHAVDRRGSARRHEMGDPKSQRSSRRVAGRDLQKTRTWTAPRDTKVAHCTGHRLWTRNHHYPLLLPRIAPCVVLWGDVLRGKLPTNRLFHLGCVLLAGLRTESHVLIRRVYQRVSDEQPSPQTFATCFALDDGFADRRKFAERWLLGGTTPPLPVRIGAIPVSMEDLLDKR